MGNGKIFKSTVPSHGVATAISFQWKRPLIVQRRRFCTVTVVPCQK